MEVGKKVKDQGEKNDLIERISADKYFDIDREKLLNLLNPKNFIGFGFKTSVRSAK